MDNLPAEKISELKQIIHSHLSQNNIQGRIKETLTEFAHDESSPTKVGAADIMEKLREKGVVEDVMRRIQLDTSTAGMTQRPATKFVDKDDKLAAAQPRANIDPSRRYLYFQIFGGRAFLEHLDEPSGAGSSTFTLHINFRGQRFKSRTFPCACEPAIQEGFLLELHKDSAGDAARMADQTTLLSICDPIHLVLIKTDAIGETTLISSYFCEWRSVLSSQMGSFKHCCELMGTASESKVPVGILDTQVELIPRITQPLNEEVIKAQLGMERSRQAEKERLFLVYAKQWWKEYLQIRPQHKDRLVKIFAQDENTLTRPVCSFVKPVRAGRLLTSPREAARFISLIHHEKTQNLSVGGGEKPEQWSTMHTFLCRNRGDCEDHALLLCGLLLGYGLDAYVCIGTKAKGQVHAWVVTISTDGLVTFWESLTGHRYIHEPLDVNAPPIVKQQHKTKYSYKTVGCVFNHQQFYANAQPTDGVAVCVFDLENESRWKCMSHDAVHSVCGPGSCPLWPQFPLLIPSKIDPHLCSNELEQQIRKLVSEHREDQGLHTIWDDQLSYLLTPALSAYELERVTGITSGNEEFQDSIRRCVPDGHTFKGYPIQFTHRNGRKAFNVCLKAPVCAEIINCRGDQVRIGLRVCVYTYPEAVCAMWLMFACKYKSVL